MISTWFGYWFDYWSGSSQQLLTLTETVLEDVHHYSRQCEHFNCKDHLRDIHCTVETLNVRCLKLTTYVGIIAQSQYDLSLLFVHNTQQQASHTHLYCWVQADKEDGCMGLCLS